MVYGYTDPGQADPGPRIGMYVLLSWARRGCIRCIPIQGPEISPSRIGAPIQLALSDRGPVGSFLFHSRLGFPTPSTILIKRVGFPFGLVWPDAALGCGGGRVWPKRSRGGWVACVGDEGRSKRGAQNPDDLMS